MSIPESPERLLGYLAAVAQTLPESFFAGYVVSVLKTRKFSYETLPASLLERIQKDIEVELRERDETGRKVDELPVDEVVTYPRRVKKSRDESPVGVPDDGEMLDLTKHTSVKEN